MQPILIIVLATAASVPLGLGLRRNLAKLRYRTADEQDLPNPGPRWWVVWTSILALGSLATAAALSHDPPVYLPLVPLAITGPWLAAVDFDVLRIPNRVLAPTTVATLLASAVTESTRDWRTIVVPVVAALLAGGVFAAVHFATRGGIGFGDVKLAGVVGLAVGQLGVGAVWASVLAGSVIALGRESRVGTVGPFPYGPWILLGSWIAALVFPVNER